VKIAIWHNLPSGGGKRALHDHVRGLVAKGHEVVSWCPPTASQKYLPLSDIIRENIVPLTWPLKHSELDTWQITLRSAREIEAMDRHCITCAQQIMDQGFDVLFANSCAFFRVTSIGRHVSIPKALYLQEPYRWLYEALPNSPWAALPRGASFKEHFKDLREARNKRLRVREEINNAFAFDKVLVNSFYSRESVMRSYGVEARTCYLGIDSAKFAPRAVPREDFVIGVSSIIPEKRVDFAIRAVGEMKSPRPRLVWVGNVSIREYRDEMMKLAQELGVSLEIQEMVSDAEMVGLLSRAAAMIYAPRLEPFGMAPLEANLCGVPVVAVPEGGVRETIRDGINGFLVESSPSSAAAALERLLSDRDLAEKMGAAGREFVRTNFSMQAATDRLDAELSALLGNPN
jgi:glycosyltransferase involved in cell wall biosynthesis